MDLILKNVAALGEREETIADIGIADGSIVAMEKGLSGDAETLDMQGRLAVPGFVESHSGGNAAATARKALSAAGPGSREALRVSARRADGGG